MAAACLEQRGRTSLPTWSTSLRTLLLTRATTGGSCAWPFANSGKGCRGASRPASGNGRSCRGISLPPNKGEADEAFGGIVAGMDMPPHARAGQIKRGHRFAAYPRCWPDLAMRSVSHG